MKKKLDNDTIQLAFDDIKLICDNVQFDEEFSIYEEYLEQFDTIELALDELIERREMMQRFNEACVPSVIDDETEKKLKALEIIKREPSMVGWQASYEDYEDYLDNTPEEQRYINSKEEYDLLKEVL